MKIYVRMLGGLGNQLFIYAFARYLSIKYDADEIVLDLRGYNKYKIREFELLNFDLNNNVRVMAENEIPCYIDLSRKFYHAVQALYRRCTKHYLEYPVNYLSKLGLYYTHFNFEKIPSKARNNIYLFGYFQSLLLFDEIKLDLLKELKLKAESADFKNLKNLINNSQHSIAISIRCGIDYKQCGFMVCDNQYYMNSLKKMYTEKSDIFVFTDDISEAKKLFQMKNAIFIPQLTPCEQLMLLKESDDFILSNSSFSWWGAYLSENPKKHVILPKQWTDLAQTDEFDLIYENTEVDV